MAALLLAAGCGLVGGSKPRKAVNLPVSAPPVTTSEDVLKIYLQTMSALGSGDPARQSDVFFEVEREFKRSPTPKTSLRYALALVTPGHPGAKPTQGRKILAELFKTPDRLSQTERSFADILFNQVVARLKLEAENRRLVETLDIRARSQANSDKRLIAQQADEILRLKRALADTEQKLNALKEIEIERSLIERSPTSPGNRDAPSETQGPATGR